MKTHVAVTIALAGALLGAARGAEDLMDRKVKLPARLMTAGEVLEEVFLQTGTRWAHAPGATVRQLDASEFGGGASVKELAGKLAAESSAAGGILVLGRKLDDAELKALTGALASADAAERRLACYRLGRSGSARALAPLYGALSDRDESVRHHALRALVHLHAGTRYEPEVFPAGRVSLLAAGERPPVKALLSLMERANDPSENEWIWAATLLSIPEADAGALSEVAKAKAHGYAPTRALAEAAAAELAAREKLRAVPPVAPENHRDAESAAEAVKGLTAAEPAARAAAARLVARRNDVAAGPVLEALRAEKDPGVRGELLLALGRKGGKEAWNLILGELASAEPVVRLFAVRALERCPDERAVETLMTRLTGKDTPADERHHAGVSLGMIGSPTAVRALSAHIIGNPAPISVSALALAYIATPECEPALLACLEIKKDPLKYYAYSGLSRIGSRKAVETVARYHDEYDNTARYCGHAAIRRTRAQEGLDRLIEAARTGQGGEQLPGIAPHGLEECDDPRAADALIECAKSAADRRLFWAVQALGRFGEARCAAALVELMKSHASEDIRWQALRALRWRWYWHRPEVRAALAAHPVFRSFVQAVPGIAEQPENTWVCRLWPVDFDDYRAVNTTYEAGLVWDSRSGRVLKWGSHGQRCDIPQLEETWLYDVAGNKWEQRDPANRPVGQCGTFGVSDDAALGKVVSMRSFGGGHGWEWDRGRSLRPSAPWVYDSGRDEWTPVRPAQSPGSRGFTSLAYVRPCQVHVICGGQDPRKKGLTHNVWAYDLYANTWHEFPLPEKYPGTRAHETTLYMPNIDRVFMKGGVYGASKDDNGTWLYDLATNTWKNARDDEPTAVPKFTKPAVYDPVTGTVLAFVLHRDRGPEAWQYEPRKNEWSKLAAAPEPAPHHDSVDVCYDPEHNLFVLDGGHTGWETDHIAVREVWTYRHRNLPRAARLFEEPPADLVVEIHGGKAHLSWKKVAEPAAGYNVYRGEGTLPWEVKFAKVTPKPVAAAEFTDPQPPPAGGKAMAFYYVTAVADNGGESEPSFRVRTQPAVPEGLVVSVRPDRTVELEWRKPAAADVVGWHVYAATVAPKTELVAGAIDDLEGWERLTAEPGREPRFLDRRELAATPGVFSHEVRAYQVRAVNSLGVESGPSAQGFTLASSVPRPRARLLPDGSALVSWDKSPEKNLCGYAVYRLDEIRNSAVVRLTAFPVPGTEFLDRAETPRAERRRYYVVAVDALGQEGLPSSGAWGFGRP